MRTLDFDLVGDAVVAATALDRQPVRNQRGGKSNELARSILFVINRKEAPWGTNEVPAQYESRPLEISSLSRRRSQGSACEHVTQTITPGCQAPPQLLSAVVPIYRRLHQVTRSNNRHTLDEITVDNHPREPCVWTCQQPSLIRVTRLSGCARELEFPASLTDTSKAASPSLRCATELSVVRYSDKENPCVPKTTRFLRKGWNACGPP